MRLDKLEEYRAVSPKVKEQVKRDLAFQTGLQIERLRILKGLTQEKLADKIGTQQASISRAENGTTLPSLGFLQKIANKLGTYVIAPKFAVLEEGRLETSSQNNNSGFDFGSTKFPIKSPIEFIVNKELTYGNF